MSISQARKRLWTIHDYITTRLATDWSHVHIIDYKDGWPDDDELVILASGQTLKKGQVPVPCLKLFMDDNRPGGGIQVGGGIEEDVDSVEVLFQCRSLGEELDLRYFLSKSFQDVVMWLLDWQYYPQDPKPAKLHRIEVDRRSLISAPIRDDRNPNPALRIGGMIAFSLIDQRTEAIHSNA